MKLKIFSCFMTLLFAIATIKTNAQIHTKIFINGIPSSIINTNTLKIPEKTIPIPDGFLKVLNEAKSSENQLEYSNKFALSQTINLDFLSLSEKIINRNSSV